MEDLKLFIVLDKEQLEGFSFTEMEGNNVKSVALIDFEDQEENVLQLLESNLVVNYSTEKDQHIQNCLIVARILNRNVIHFSRLREYVK